jgi:hypothetical protein
MARSGTLTTAQGRALDALLTSASVRAAAAASGTPERTLFRWLADEAFSGELARRRRELSKQVLASLAGGAESAIREMQGLVTGATSEAVRRAACRDVIDLILRVSQQQDIDERLAAIERAMEANE